MTNVFTTAEPVLLAHVKTITGLAGACWGRRGRYGLPHVQLDWGPGTPEQENTGVIDIACTFNCRIFAGDRAKCFDIWQELLTLWNNATKIAEYRAVDVVDIAPDDHDPPITWGAPTPGQVFMDMLFNITLTITYT